jgi:hypothetical protein
MSLSLYKTDFANCLERAATLLAGPVRAVYFEWEAQKLLRKRLKIESRIGFSGHDPILNFGAKRRPDMVTGFDLCSLRIGDRTVPLVQVSPPSLDYTNSLDDFWVVQTHDLAMISRFVRRLSRNAIKSVAPVMDEADQHRLLQNTIGFLRSPREPFRRFRIPKKRGVLLLGAPGNGKTMACRWLAGECSKVGLMWRSVSAQEYRSARANDSLGELFHLDRPGVVLFDDFDLGIRDRDQAGANDDHSVFLSELDGMASRCGIVFLFTSNARLNQLDPAFRRPGRIDVIMEFRAPDVALRRRYLAECWQAEIAAQVDLEEIATITEGLNFAELEELRKLLVLDYLETDQWNWPRAWQAFNSGRGPTTVHKIGFGKTLAEGAATPALTKRELLEARDRE